MKSEKIIEVQLIPVKNKDGLVGFASVVLNGIYLGSIGVYKRLAGEGFRITYPTKKVGSRNINIFHPINRETGRTIEKAILIKAEEIFI